MKTVRFSVVTGLSYTGGALARRGVKCPKDGVAVETFRNAGAIPLCVTNTPELCGAFHSKNFLHGETKNPYDRRRTPGGSSGGEVRDSVTKGTVTQRLSSPHFYRRFHPYQR